MPLTLLTQRPTTFVRSPRLNAELGLDLTLASETLQYTGSFKFCGAFATAAQTPAQHLIAASSGNFGQALAFACQLHGKRCTIVMPLADATRLLFLFLLANLKAEPTGALALAAVLTDPERYRSGRVCCVVTGGNADPATYIRLLSLDRPDSGGA